MKSKIVFGVAGILFAGAALAAGADLMQGYRSAGAGPFSAEAGGSAWTQTHQSAGAAGARGVVPVVTARIQAGPASTSKPESLSSPWLFRSIPRD